MLSFVRNRLMNNPVAEALVRDRSECIEVSMCAGNI